MFLVFFCFSDIYETKESSKLFKRRTSKRSSKLHIHPTSFQNIVPSKCSEGKRKASTRASSRLSKRQKTTTYTSNSTGVQPLHSQAMRSRKRHDGQPINSEGTNIETASHRNESQRTAHAVAVGNTGTAAEHGNARATNNVDDPSEDAPKLLHYHTYYNFGRTYTHLLMVFTMSSSGPSIEWISSPFRFSHPLQRHNVQYGSVLAFRSEQLIQSRLAAALADRHFQVLFYTIRNRIPT